MAVKRKCVCCGKEYDYCPTCAKKDQPQWMYTYCSEACKNLFKVVAAYNMNLIDKNAVKEYVSAHNITGQYTAPVEKVIYGTVEEIRTQDTNKKNEEPTENDLKEKAVIPTHNVESQSWSRRKRRKHR